MAEALEVVAAVQDPRAVVPRRLEQEPEVLEVVLGVWVDLVEVPADMEAQEVWVDTEEDLEVQAALVVA